ncbi:MAG: carotenoid 1,2-hydratase, partial [Pseudomonadota bacterium]
QGSAYVDSNWGSEPLETGFRYWDWSRAHTKDGARVLYDAFERDGKNRQLALAISKTGKVEEHAPPPRISLKTAPIWGVKRSTLSDGKGPKTLQMLEDTPFYTRSHVGMSFDGEEVVAVHESLDLDRFASPWVRFLLPFRMPRRANR